ncbi:MAG: enoyl-CoA hydratase/isomerase [Alphaproteobacteria bacterium]|nr:enoyl-CoA hydratase/isomerase [Alphaproteobacteria bacterium]
MALVEYALEGDIALITLNDPGSLNAASIPVAAELKGALERAESEARCAILTGAGRGFCSGANLSAEGGGPASRQGPGGLDAGGALATTYNPLVTTMRELSVPLVTAVNGPAAGVGCSLALLGDIIVAGESAYFLQAFRRIGLVPDGGSTYLLPRMVGRARAMEMMLLGEKISAKTALEWGMINKVVPDAELMRAARGYAEQLASGPKSIALIRKLAWDSLDNDWSRQLQAERMTQRTAGRTEDFQEGVLAFQQKRQAEFKGR